MAGRTLNSPEDSKVPACPEIAAGDFEAVIVDLDGVVTDTAGLHAAAWKQVFDAYLERREGPAFRPFEIDEDYRATVDGKPRYEGVRGFLRSRGIDLPDGAPDDSPDAETVCGLGNAKQRLFRRVLGRAGAPVYESSVNLLQRLKAEGIALAVVSSSRNCRAILEAAGIRALFDTLIDGIVAAERDLRGKPEPDTFLAAAELLDCPPARAVVIEDALAGVAAGRRGGFGLVVGVDRTAHRTAHGDAHGDDLRQAGADLVVADLAELAVRPLPSALTDWREIADRIADQRPVVFLDYDGTLTPIVDRPELALMDDEARATVRALSDRLPVAVVSGRDATDVRALVGLAEIVYCGSHGFEIIGPDGLERRYATGFAFLPAIDAAEQALRAALAGIDGLLIERKRFSVAVHYRLVAESNVAAVFEAVGTARAAQPELRQMAGKKVLELRPDLDWDKGRAIFWLLETMGLDLAAVAPIYFGDDLTDEDAFRALRDHGTGIGIVVCERPRRTAAHYRLADPGDVLKFLRKLAQLDGHFGEPRR